MKLILILDIKTAENNFIYYKKFEGKFNLGYNYIKLR